MEYSKKERTLWDAEVPKIDRHFEAWTDGGCNNLSPEGEGGSAYIIVENGEVIHTACKGMLHTTNNRAEMLAAISAVNWIPQGATITVNTDSQYTIGAFSDKNKVRASTKNKDLIEMFHKCAFGKEVIFRWVKGHAEDKYNNMCDELCNQCTEAVRKKYSIPFYTYHNSPKIER